MPQSGPEGRERSRETDPGDEPAVKKIPQIEPAVGKEERDAVLAVVDSGFLTEGGKTRELEAAIAAFLDVPYAIAANNATAGLTIALAALGIGPGDEVVVPDFTFIATANAVALAGATPVFADVDPNTFVIDLGDAAKHLTPRTRAIIPVHLNGRAPEMDEVARFARRYGLVVVEDAAQALGSRQRGRCLGTFGEAGVFSLGTTKIITTGQGGIVATRRKDLYEACIRLKDHGRATRSSEVHETFGFNSKFTDLQAALGLAQLGKLPERIEKKRELYRWYRDELAGLAGIDFPPTELEETVPWFVDVLCADRARLESYLQAAGTGTRRFYRPLHSQPCFQAAGEYPATEAVASRGLWLPSSVTLSRDAIEGICREVKACAAEFSEKRCRDALASGRPRS
jgi:perosamine synthetase